MSELVGGWMCEWVGGYVSEWMSVFLSQADQVKHKAVFWCSSCPSGQCWI